ncbi:host nuclease inhibitor protein [Pseudomonas phage ZY21]|nr:host nuclease inhibitor protein [Pseudomonas phage ZY21]
MVDQDGNEVDPEVEIKHFAHLIVEWHENRLETIDDLLNSPPDKGLKIHNEEDGSDIIIEGDKLKGFMAGMQVAKLIFAKLPFTLEDPTAAEEPEDEEEPQQEPTRPADFGHFS